METIEERFGLHGKIAIVTGGGSGIGKAIGLGLMSAGATVVICGRRMEKLQSVKEQAEKEGFLCDTYQLNIRDEAEVVKCVKTVKEKYGSIRHLSPPNPPDHDS